jgi:hypothetical protein
VGRGKGIVSQVSRGPKVGLWVVASVSTLLTLAFFFLLAFGFAFAPTADSDWRLWVPGLAVFALMVWAWVKLFRQPGPPGPHPPN